jgi:hypothetical protein
MRTRLLAPAATALLLAACLGTKDPYNPGTPLGTYAVSGAIMTNACGDGLGAMGTWTFDVKLSQDGTTLYWVQGGLPVSGTLDAQGHTTMSSTSSQMIHDANPRAGVGACTIDRTDALDLTLSKDTTTFTGTLAYTFGPSDGSDCADQLSAAGGPYAAFPCNVQYALTGTRTSTAAK